MDTPHIRLISRPIGSTKAIIFINGWLTENRKDENTVASALRLAGWNDAVYQLWWDSGDINPLKLKFDIWWDTFKNRAEKIGTEYLSKLITYMVPENHISFVGYSLGVRIIFYALINWSGSHTLQDAIFLGGAIGREQEERWINVASILTGKIINIYNRDDFMLDKIYKNPMLTWNSSPCGLKPIEEFSSKIVNEDATDFVGYSHAIKKYCGFLPIVARKQVWKP